MRTGVLESYTDLDPDRVHVVKNGIDPDEFAPDSGTEVVTGLGIDLDKPSVVFVGRITRQKGLVHLIRAAEQLEPDTQVVLLAGAADTPEISREFGEAFAHLQASRGGVLWVEEMLPRASVRQVLSHATVFACPSVYEPLGGQRRVRDRPGDQDQPAGRRPRAGPPVRQGRTAALHRRVQLGEDRRRDGGGLPQGARATRELRPCLLFEHRRSAPVPSGGTMSEGRSFRWRRATTGAALRA
jgi:hypothetical protein